MDTASILFFGVAMFGYMARRTSSVLPEQFSLPSISTTIKRIIARENMVIFALAVKVLAHVQILMLHNNAIVAGRSKKRLAV